MPAQRAPKGMAQCPACKGRGEWLIPNRDPQQESDDYCRACNGRGYLTREQAAEYRRPPGHSSQKANAA
jgi:DnaJ-class molecular chaperone